MYKYAITGCDLHKQAFSKIIPYFSQLFSPCKMIPHLLFGIPASCTGGIIAVLRKLCFFIGDVISIKHDQISHDISDISLVFFDLLPGKERKLRRIKLVACYGSYILMIRHLSIFLKSKHDWDKQTNDRIDHPAKVLSPRYDISLRNRMYV